MAISPPPPSVGDKIRVVLGTLGLDKLHLSPTAITPIVCCRNPGVDATNVRIDKDIDLTIMDMHASGLSEDAKIYVTTDSVETLVYDQATTTTAAGWSVSDTLDMSYGSGVNDINRLILSHTTDFISEEIVSVRVEATNVNTDTLNETYTFTVQDVTQPSLVEASPFGIRKVRVEFSELMDDSETVGGSLYVRNISGRVKFIAPNIIEAPLASFTSTDTSLFVGVAGAKEALNNGAHEITTVLSSTQVEVDSEIVNEDIVDPRVDTVPEVRLSCYRFVHIAPTDPTIIEPAFEPIVLDVELPDIATLAPGVDQRLFVDLTLQDDLTPLVNYNLEARKIEDISGNEIGSVIQFTSWTPFAVNGRDFDLWKLIPAMNRREDVTQDLERLIKSLDEAAQVLLYDVDQFGLIKDPDAVKAEALDTMLTHLGNPLPFTRKLTEQKKRELIPLLVPMYKQKGTAEGIVDSTIFFLGPNVTQVRVLPMAQLIDSWILGESELGASAASSVSGNAEPYVVAGGSTLTVLVDEDAEVLVDGDVIPGTEIPGYGSAVISTPVNPGVQTITFTGFETSVADVVSTINTQLTGATAAPGGFGDSKVVIASNTSGLFSSVEVTGGTANAVLGFSTDKKVGYGSTILAPASGFLRFAFEVEVTSAVALTDEDREIIVDIINFVKPAHTHFVRLIEIVP